MAPGGDQRTYWNVPQDLIGGQRLQVQNYDVSVMDDIIGNIRGGGGTDKYRESSYLLVEATVTTTMPIIWVGVDGRFNDVSP